MKTYHGKFPSHRVLELLHLSQALRILLRPGGSGCLVVGPGTFASKPVTPTLESGEGRRRDLVSAVAISPSKTEPVVSGALILRENQMFNSGVVFAICRLQ